MNFRRKPGIFKELFSELKDWTASKEAFEYTYPTNDIDFIVDEIRNIDVSIIGTYFLKSDNKIYSQDSVELEACVPYNKINGYFIDEFKSLRLIDDIYNNTIIGQYGITINFGDLFEESTFTNPSFYFMYNRTLDFSPLESDYNTIDKTLNFDIGVAVNEGDLFESNWGYANYDFYTDFLYSVINDYFNECPQASDIVNNRITYWKSDDSIVEESRPLLRGLITNDISYK